MTVKRTKLALESSDSKRIIQPDGVSNLALGHFRI